MLFQRAQKNELLLGQFARAGLACIKVAIELLAAADQVRWRFGQFEASAIRSPLSLDHQCPRPQKSVTENFLALLPVNSAERPATKHQAEAERQS